MKLQDYKALMRGRGSRLEQKLIDQISYTSLPQPEREYRFHPKRRWRFDFAYPERRLAIEIEGGTWCYGKKSRHTTAAGFSNDCEKYNAATLLGWRVLRFDSVMVKSGRAREVLQDALGIQ